jgi:hypothetical protein
MKIIKNLGKYGFVALVTLPLCSAMAQALAPNTAEVVKLSQSGMSDDVVIAYVKNSQTSYNLSADDILALKNSGVSSPVVATMLIHDTALKSKTTVAPVAVAAPPAAPVVQTPPPAPQPDVVVVPPPVTVVPAPAYYYYDDDYWYYSGGRWVVRPSISLGFRFGGGGHGHGHWR